MTVMNRSKNSEFKLFIPRKVYMQLMHWVDKSTFEVSWFGLLKFDKKNSEFVVTKIFLLPQENSSTSTEMNGAAIADLLYDTRKEPGDLRWWGHSHVNMDVFWSGTDIATMKNLSTGGWFLSTVFNKKREMKTALTQDIPNGIPVLIDDIETHIWDYPSDEEEKEWDKQYTDNVKNTVAPQFGWKNKPADRTKKDQEENRTFSFLKKVMDGEMDQAEFEAHFLGKLADDDDDKDWWTPEFDDRKMKKSASSNELAGNTEALKSIADQLIMQQIMERKEAEKAQKDDNDGNIGNWKNKKKQHGR